MREKCIWQEILMAARSNLDLVDILRAELGNGMIENNLATAREVSALIQILSEQQHKVENERSRIETKLEERIRSLINRIHSSNVDSFEEKLNASPFEWLYNMYQQDSDSSNALIQSYSQKSLMTSSIRTQLQLCTPKGSYGNIPVLIDEIREVISKENLIQTNRIESIRRTLQKLICRPSTSELQRFSVWLNESLAAVNTSPNKARSTIILTPLNIPRCTKKIGLKDSKHSHKTSKGNHSSCRRKAQSKFKTFGHREKLNEDLDSLQDQAALLDIDSDDLKHFV